MFWLEDGDQIEVVNGSRQCEDQVEDIDELRASLSFPCIHLKKVGINCIYESEDTEDFMSKSEETEELICESSGTEDFMSASEETEELICESSGSTSKSEETKELICESSGTKDFIYELKDSQDFMEEKLADFFNSLYVE
ncbi:hypothetical protein AMTR_s00109p00126330 [Amborella trichopoda]|uniref:Uncharacterized protein n=1 Tax=Amborella trichopoda TaxID=13333 RepID=W1NVK1_AMBTC|nr:hypothetical protein AMTR_s00109p00126330 [Amborella trichopoda]